jgi:hypothetical protein
MLIEENRIINLPKVEDPRGNLSFIEECVHIPFIIKRIYWIYDVPGGQTRDGHAYLKNCEFIIALSGSFDVLLDNGEKETLFSLNRSYYGLYIKNRTWRSLNNFSTNSVALILSSTLYDENDYIRDYETFKRIASE